MHRNVKIYLMWHFDRPHLFTQLQTASSCTQDTLSRKERAAALGKYGKVLISQRAEASTRLLMELCIGGSGESVAGGPPDEAAFVSSVADFAHLYNDRPTALMLLCEFIMNSAGSSSGSSLSLASRQHEKILYHTLLELYLADHLPDEEHRASADDASSSSGGGIDPRAPRGPAAAASSSGQKDGGLLVTPTGDPHLRASRQARALELLQKGWPSHLMNEPKYDPDHALVRATKDPLGSLARHRILCGPCITPPSLYASLRSFVGFIALRLGWYFCTTSCGCTGRYSRCVKPAQGSTPGASNLHTRAILLSHTRCLLHATCRIDHCHLYTPPYPLGPHGDGRQRGSDIGDD